MPNGTGNKSLSVVNLILLAMAVIVFISTVDVEIIALHVLALFFIILSGAALAAWPLFFAFVARNHNKIFFNSGISTALFLYFIATVVLAFLINLFRGDIFLFILCNLMIIACTVVIVLLVQAVSRHIAPNERSITGAKTFMDDCELRLYNLIADSNNTGYLAELNKLYEAVKHADKIGSSSVDPEIDMSLERLEKALAKKDDSRAQANIDAILTSLDDMFIRRNGEITTIKRGGF